MGRGEPGSRNIGWRCGGGTSTGNRLRRCIMRKIPTIDDVLEARERLKERCVLTPLIESPALNARAGGLVLVKAECLQRTGSFKFRGAWNCISRLSGESAKGGVVS